MGDYTKFKEIYDEIDYLLENKVSSSTPEFIAWKEKTERFLIKKYGQESYEFNNFKKLSFSLTLFTQYTPDEAFIAACARDLNTIKLIFENYLRDMIEENVNVNTNDKKASFDKVFIVHGHNDELKESIARLIDRQEITPIILHEQVNRGATIIEKIESNSDVQAAICLFTADDLGKEKNDREEKLRARQNVIFEAGYFIGKLGREHTIIISDENIEIPTDLQGIVYTNSTDWKLSILKELRAIGYSIDYNKIEQ